MLCCAQLCQCVAFCHSRLQTRKAGALHQIDQRWRSVNSADYSALLRTCQFLTTFFVCEVELSLQSGAHFGDLIFQKCSERLNSFNILNRKSSSRHSPVRFLSTTVPDRAPHPNIDPTSATPGATLPDKTLGFAPENVFTREFTRFRTLTLLYCSDTRTALAHHVVDMIIT